jgi:hypothetical protein
MKMIPQYFRNPHWSEFIAANKDSLSDRILLGAFLGFALIGGIGGAFTGYFLSLHFLGTHSQLAEVALMILGFICALVGYGYFRLLVLYFSFRRYLAHRDPNERRPFASPVARPRPSRRPLMEFSRSRPWSSIGWLHRIARVCRILFGCVMFSIFVAFVVLAICGIFFSTSVGEVLMCLVVIPFVGFIAWAVGGMFIWRGVYPPSPPSSDGPPPPEPPTGGAPRPAPLLPFSPRILSAHAELPIARGNR